ncbi:MAG TPA: glycosyltransferase family 4 protein [Planctomycetota bacterium]|nr:glycosyltransferase family 4 protein [Planctomycetota bacterium]
MKTAFIAAGAAGMYCGTCLKDNALASALRVLGEDVTLVPTYTPLRVDEESASGERVFFGGIDVYLQEKFPLLRARRGILSRLLGSQVLLRMLSRAALSTSPANLGRLTISMLRGEDGNQRRSLLELTEWLSRDVRPDIVHLSNSLLVGFAREIRKALQVPVVCSLGGEDLFLEGLPDRHRLEALQLIRERGADIKRFIATSAYCAGRMASLIGLDRARIDVVLPGISLSEYGPPLPRPEGRPLTIGYLARISPEKGLHILADAFRLIVERGELPDVRLRVAGYLGGKDIRYAAAVRSALTRGKAGHRVEILGTLERSEKLEFLRSIDLLAVPTVYAETKGIFVLEALASGVPVVEPAHGSFPELIDATGGGVLHEPGSAEDLARKLVDLLLDPARREDLGRKGREAVLERFSSARMAEETLLVYRKVIAKGSP